MSTLAALRTEVLAHGFDSTVYTTRINDYINQAQQRIARRLDIRELQTKSTISTVAGTQAYSIPADFVRAKSVTDITTPTQGQQGLKFVPIDLIDEQTSVRGTPVMYAISSEGIVLYPTPDAVYSLQLRYFKDVTTLSADGDISIVTADYHDLLVSYALSRAYRSEDDPEQARNFMADFKEGLASLANDRQFEDEDGPSQIPGTWDGTAWDSYGEVIGSP